MKNQKLFLLPLLLVSCILFTVTSAHAQSIDPNVWQTQSVGLKSKSIPLTKGFNVMINRKMTAGQVLSVGTDSNPFLMVSQDGVTDGGWGKIKGVTGIDLGEIKIVGQANFNLTAENTNWVKNEMTFNNGSSQLKVVASRLSPAVLIQSSSNYLDFFSGNVYGDTIVSGNLTSRSLNPSSPKYIAYSSGGTIQTKTLSTTLQALPLLDSNWVLIWYGTNSHFVSTKRPLNNEGIRQNESYQADVPILFIFQNQPTSFKNSVEGGVEFSFSNQAGLISLMPLFGYEHQKALITEGWGSSGLPQIAKDKITFWEQRSCNYPTDVLENYSYSASSDKVTITENISFTPICSNPTKFAPIPPMMAVAKDAFGSNLTFSAPLINANTPTDIGPTFGIDNVDTYSWSLVGLNKYTNNKRILGSTTAPAELINELNSEIDKLIQGGHFAPWEYVDHLPIDQFRGEVYFLNPADNIYHLVEIAEALPDSQDPNNIKNKLINYIKSEKSNFPPETVFNLPAQGTVRTGFNQNNYSVMQTAPGFSHFLSKVSLYNFYSLSRYHDLTKEPVPNSVIAAGKSVLDNNLKEMDWASMFWFNGFSEKRDSKVSLNRHSAGILGLSHLLNLVSDPAEGLSRALMAKAFVAQVGFSRYPRYLYASNLVELPSDPAWQPKSMVGIWNGIVFNYNWTTGNDDARQIAQLNQFGIWLHDNSGFYTVGPSFYAPEWNYNNTAHMTTYKYIVPEVFRLLSDYAKNDSKIYLDKSKILFPHWYASFAEGTLGGEHNLAYPMDGYQMFMAEVFFNNPNGDTLRKLRDIPWVSADLFYTHKLAETIKAYEGISWSDQIVVSPSPLSSLFLKPGDLDNDNDVDIFDYNLLLTDFGKIGSGIAGDIDGDSKVDIFDYNTLLTNFGK